MYICNGCHDLLMMSITLPVLLFQTLMMLICRRIITGISKSEAIKLMQNIDFSEKRGTLSIIKKSF